MENNKFQKYIYVSLCIAFLIGCISLYSVQNLPVKISFVAINLIELTLLVIIFLGISGRLFTEHIFNRIVLNIFYVSAVNGKFDIIPDLSKYESVNLLTYWAEVILTLFALRLLQLVEYSAWNKITIITNLIWFFLLCCYWYCILNKIIRTGYKLNPRNNSHLRVMIDNKFKSLSNKLFGLDCAFWILFSVIPGPPSGGLVICLFLFTTVALIDEYTSKGDPLNAVLEDKYRCIALISLACACLWLQWDENNSSFINHFWSYTSTIMPIKGLFYPVLMYYSILLIAIWRGADRHSKKEEENSSLLTLLTTAVHNTKNEALALIEYDIGKLSKNEEPGVVVRVENLSLTIIGMWLVVKPELRHTMKVKVTSPDGNAQISVHMVKGLILNILNSALSVDNIETDEEKGKAPDHEILPTVKAIVKSNTLTDSIKEIMSWEEITPTYWTVSKSHDELTGSSGNILSDKADIGLLRSAISEIIRNALRHNSETDPKIMVRVFIEGGYLIFEVQNYCWDNRKWKYFKDLEEDESLLRKGGGLHSLSIIRDALNLKLRFKALNDNFVKITLGVLIENG